MVGSKIKMLVDICKQDIAGKNCENCSCSIGECLEKLRIEYLEYKNFMEDKFNAKG